VAELWTLSYSLEAMDVSKFLLAGGMDLDEKGRIRWAVPGL
jgi:hypothetical protein